MKKEGGFTLIEVLLVTLLLFFLAYTTFTAVRSTMSAKRSIDERSLVLQPARAIMGLLERDLRSSFFVTPEDLVWKILAAPQLPDEPPPTPPVKKSPVTIFQGKVGEIFMTTATHQRLTANTPENEQHFVTYQLEGDKLLRAESIRAVSADDRGDQDNFHKFTLLEGVKVFKLSYWNSRSGSWSDSWDTDNAEFKERLPEAVKVELEYTPETNNKKESPPNVAMTTTITLAYAVFKRPPVATGTSTQ